MMTTASFAWFSMNGSVAAKNMEVTATTPASLEISANGSSWAYEASATTAAGTKLQPVTWYEDTDPAGANTGWYVPSDTNKIQTDGQATTNTISNASITDGKWKKVADADEIAATYALVNTFYLRTNTGEAEGGSAIKFKASASVLGGNLEDGVKVYVYGKTADGNTKMVDITDGTDVTWEAPTSGNIALTVIIIYDGQEHTVINNDNADSQSTKVVVTFAVPTV
jgi:hypothetical protein